MTLDELDEISGDQKTVRKFLSCYQSAQQPDRIGIQSSLPMRDLAPLLPSIVLMEAEQKDKIYYRIVGEKIVDRMGFNPTGLNLIDLLEPKFGDELPNLHQTMMDHPCGYYSVYENEYDSGARMVTESIVLPMRKTPESKANCAFALHIHHETTSIQPSKGETTLVTRLKKGALIDLGAGIPEIHLPESILSELRQTP